MNMQYAKTRRDEEERWMSNVDSTIDCNFYNTLHILHSEQQQPTSTHLEGGMGGLDGLVGQIGGDAGQSAAGVVLRGQQGRRASLRRRMLLVWLWLGLL